MRHRLPLNTTKYRSLTGVLKWAGSNPVPPKARTGKTVAVIGSGPAGLACAAQLNTAGHAVTIFERDDRPGGLLMYGIPNMKLEKHVVERRIQLMKDEGIRFVCNREIGRDVAATQLQRDFDALVICTGATVPRNLLVKGRNLKGIHFAMEYLTSTTKSLLDSNFDDGRYISGKDKNVVVIGGGRYGHRLRGHRSSARLQARAPA